MTVSSPGEGAGLGRAAAPRGDDALERGLPQLLVALLAFAALLTPLVFRGADDNRLTSWQWLFGHASVAWLVPLAAVCIALAYLLRRLAWPPRGAQTWLFACAFAAGASFWSEPEVVVDAARYFTHAKYMATHGFGAFMAAWGDELAAWTDLPLVPALYGLVFHVAGEGRLPIQVLTTLLFAATVVLTYWLGAELWDDALGFTAAVLLLAMPYLLTQVPLMLADVPAMFFVTLAFLATVKALKGNDARWSAGAAVAIAAAAMAKYSAALYLTALAPVFLTDRGGGRTSTARKALVLLAPAFLVALALVIAKPDAVLTQWWLLWEYQRPGLARWSESAASTFFFQLHPFIGVAAACSVHAAMRARDKRYAMVGWALALALLGGIGRIRYLVPLLPLVALAASYGIRELRNPETRTFATLCAAFCALAVAWSAYLPFLRSTSASNLPRAGAYLDAAEARRVEVIALAQPRAELHPAVSVPLLDLFTRKPLVYRAHLVPVSPPGNVATSPLRFTWEYAPWRHYDAAARGEGEETAVVLIFGDVSQPLPTAVARRLERHCATGEFMASEGVFGYQTLIRVHEPAGGPHCPMRGVP